jgi:hypothetical protein
MVAMQPTAMGLLSVSVACRMEELVPVPAAYAKLRIALACTNFQPMLNVQLAARFVPVMHRHSA